MIPVEQTRFYRADDHPLGPSRGNCVAACVASIFEIPISQADATGTGYGQDLMTWTTEQYPALRCVHTSLTKIEDDWDQTGEGWRNWPELGDHREFGYWIAGVHSPRIPDEIMRGCGCADRTPGGDPDCEWCHGKPDERFLGIQWGLHAVVMNDRELVWDPSPRRADGVARLRAATTWHVIDPSKL